MGIYKIYQHTTPSGKVYIGQTKCKYINNWWGKNGAGYVSCPAFYHAIQKYGWDNIKHEILFEGLTKEQADQIEIELIAKYKALGISYNIDNGGYHTGGYVPWNKGKKLGPHKPETIEKIKQQRGWKHREESKRQMSESHTGLTQTDEHKAHISKALKGKRKSTEHAQHIRDNHWSKTATPEELQKIGKATRGKIMINDGAINKFILPEELDDALNSGWIRGAIFKPRRKRNRYKPTSLPNYIYPFKTKEYE